MAYISTTPFRRAMTAVPSYRDNSAHPSKNVTNTPNKWEVLRELATARTVYGLNDRDLSVLQALISFHPNSLLEPGDRGLVVHPSNASLCDRLNGMPCSTMRRHMAKLVNAGVVTRRDSPNGKRYVRRHGPTKVAFGFDLSPLVRRFREFCDAAETIRAERDAIKRLRETISLMRRDLADLAEHGSLLAPHIAMWDAFSDLAILTARDLRRKLDLVALQDIETRLSTALTSARNVLDDVEPTDPSANDAQIEHHIQNTDPYLHDLKKGEVENISIQRSTISLNRVLETCAEFRSFLDQPVRHWNDLVRVADCLRPMMGIAPSAWEDAKRGMGPEQAAIVILVMLERFSEIQNPGGYLRALNAKAMNGFFCCERFLSSSGRRAT